MIFFYGMDTSFLQRDEDNVGKMERDMYFRVHVDCFEIHSSLGYKLISKFVKSKGLWDEKTRHDGVNRLIP